MKSAAMRERELALLELIEKLRLEGASKLAGKIIAIVSAKGSQGKTLLAKELGWILDLIVADLDWAGGCVSRLLGCIAAQLTSDRLIEAIFDPKGRAPRLHRSRGRPDLVLGSDALEENQPPPDRMTELLLSWTRQWQQKRPQGVLVDTHPSSSAALGAAQAADLVLMPVMFGTGELDALETALDKLRDFPLLLVPNATPRKLEHLPGYESKRLLALAQHYDVPISQAFIRHQSWLPHRQLRTVIAASPSFGAKTADLTDDTTALAQEVIRYAA
ncbi:hypothetical protein [Amycolatopsis anabasis]|uniref:hypothetical protein n=1 Tax=Amycolatopsis anabasis TaxID=1840409 RepID=UPI00131E315A|nr:hypothetical protein [Amycolatopsis anabasis]